jgi:hydroxypyruvate isomerase
MENYKKMYDDLLAEFEQYKRESIKWSVEDFTNYDHPTHTITEEDAQHALETMISEHDASVGISWYHVEYYIEDYGTEK